VRDLRFTMVLQTVDRLGAAKDGEEWDAPLAGGARLAVYR
jgi:hypothetical protein